MRSSTANPEVAVPQSVVIVCSAIAALVGTAAIILTEPGTGVMIFAAAAAPLLALFVLTKPRVGLFALVFLAPYVDVLKTASLGVTFRFNEIFGLLLFVVAVCHVLKTKQRFKVGTFDLFVFGLLAVMAASAVVNLDNLPSEERLRRIPTAWIGVTGVLDTPQMATCKKLAQALVAFAAYFAIRNLITTWHTWRKAVATLLVSSLIVSAWSILNLAAFTAGIQNGLGLTVQNIWYSNDAPRIRGTLSEPSFFANFLLMVIPVALFCSVRGTRLIGRRWDIPAALVLCVTLVLTFSGGGWVVFAVQVALMLGIFLRYNLPIGRLCMAFLAVTVVISIALMAVALFTNMDYGKLAIDNWNKITSLLSTGVGSGRRVAPDVGFMMFRDHPLLGVGPGRFMTFEYDYLLRLGFRGEPPHSSLYAGVMGELGLLGALMVLGLFTTAVCTTLRWAARAPHQLTRSILWGLGTAFLAMSVHYLAHDILWWPYVWVLFALAVSGAGIARELTQNQCTNWEADR